MVDRVELGALHQREQVLHLDRHPAVVRDERAQALGEPDDVRDVGVDVVQRDELRRPVLGADLGARLGREERRERRDALLPGRLADVHRRLDPQAPDTARDDVLQQVAVVARDLDDERLGPQPEPLHRAVDEPPRVLHPAGGERREVGVLGERLLGRDQRRQLGQQAASRTPARAAGRSSPARSTASAVRNSSHGGVAPRSRKLRSCARPAESAGQRRIGGGGGGVRRRLGQHPQRPPVGSPAPAGSAVSTRRSVPRTPDGSATGCDRRGYKTYTGVTARRERWMPDVQGTSDDTCIEPILADVTRPRGHRRAHGADELPGPWDHERPVRRGVTAAPRILVPMVQVRILAAERQVRAGAHCGDSRLQLPVRGSRPGPYSWHDFRVLVALIVATALGYRQHA